MIIRKSQLILRADHSLGPLPSQLGALDLGPIGQAGPHRGHRHQCPFDHIGRATDNGQLFTAHIHLAHREVVRSCHGPHADDLPHHNPVKCVPGPQDGRFQPQGREHLGKGLGLQIEIDELLKPFDGDLHGQNWWRKRRSPS